MQNVRARPGEDGVQGNQGEKASRHSGRTERGQVVVLFALLLPMLLALSTIVMDVGWVMFEKPWDSRKSFASCKSSAVSTI